MNFRLLKSGALCALALAANMSAAQDDARGWFARMGKAVEELDYRGTFVHVHDNRPEMLEVLHKIENGRVFERLTSLSGSGREVIRNGDEVRCIFRDRKQILIDWRADESPLRSVLPAYDEDLERYYSFELRADGGQVASRPTRFVAVKPKDKFRYGYRLWLDEETAMPLSCELISGSGQVIEAIQFTEIEFSAKLTAADFKPRLPTTNFAELQPAPKQARKTASVAAARWNVEDLPAGFELTVVNHRDEGPNAVEHLVFTDGLASISVFAEPHKQNRATIDGAANIGIASAFGRRVQNFQITVVGEVPPATVKRIGNSIRPIR